MVFFERRSVRKAGVRRLPAVGVSQASGRSSTSWKAITVVICASAFCRFVRSFAGIRIGKTMRLDGWIDAANTANRRLDVEKRAMMGTQRCPVATSGGSSPHASMIVLSDTSRGAMEGAG
jgi:hypothetical protein